MPAGRIFDELLRSKPKADRYELRELPFDLIASSPGTDYPSLAPTGPVNPWSAAGVAIVSGDFVEAAEIYADTGAAPEEAYARLLAAEQLVEPVVRTTPTRN